MEIGTPDPMLHEAVGPICRDEGNDSRRLVDRLRGRPFHQTRGPRAHRGVGQRHHYRQCGITRRSTGGGQVQTKPPQAGDRAQSTKIRGTKTTDRADPLRESFGQSQASLRQIRLQWEQ